MQEKKKKLRHQLGIRILLNCTFFFITQTQGIHRFDSQILIIFLDIIENIFGSMMKRKFNVEMQGNAKAIK